MCSCCGFGDLEIRMSWKNGEIMNFDFIIVMMWFYWQPGQSDRELNPFWRDGGQGLPQVEEPQPDSLSLAAASAGDHGVAWLRRALRRVQEQAKEQGRSEEAVAADRWGSLEKLKNMLAEAQHRCRSHPRGGDRGGRRGGRVQGPAPKPREYEDWREDPTAGESAAAQSEVVGDKSRYRSWLGLKEPSPQKEPSSDEDDDFDYDKLDEPPMVVEGLELKEKCGKDKEKNLILEKRASEDEDEETDGKIMFRSSKSRKENTLFTKSRVHTKDKLNAFGIKFLERSIRVKEKEMDSDEDEKLFSEWRNESKTKGDESDDDPENKRELEARESNTSEKSNEEKQKVKYVEERESEDSRKINPPSSDDLRERIFQIRNKEKLAKEYNKKEEGVVKDTKEGKEQEVRNHSNNNDNRTEKDDSLLMSRNISNVCSERRNNSNEEPKERKERRDDKDRHRENSDKRRDKGELDRRKGSGREETYSFSKGRRKVDEDDREKRVPDERNPARIEDRKERYDDSRITRKREDANRHSYKDREQDDHRESKGLNRGGEDEYRSESRHRSSRDRQSGSRRTEVPDYLRKRDSSPIQYERAPPRRLERFQKPEEDVGELSKSVRHDILGDARVFHGSSSSKNWKKKEFHKPEERVVQKEQASSSLPSKQLPNIQPVQLKEKEEEKVQPEVQMSDAEMNALGAKVLKAELLGNHALAAKLKAQLEQAQAARQQRGKIPPATNTNKAKEEETVILTQRDSKGFVRPLPAPTHAEPSGGRRRPQRVATHGSDGLRERFFPDDDKYTLENMFQKEKLTTMEETNEEFCRLAAKGAGHPESEYDLDDIFAEKASREKPSGKLQALERNRAIQQHKRVERSLDSCTRCFDSPRMLKHLLIALGNKVYLSLPAHQSLMEGHCLLAPIHHVPCATQLDEDVWEEMVTFRKALVAMFLKQDEDCIFFESSMHLRRFPHMVLECVPLPKEVGDTAPIYFKKAIMESEAEWSMNKKLVDLKGKGVRRAVPKGLPYFAVDFGNDDGFAHVIEDEKLFPENFAQEIIGGMMDLDHSLWRKQRREDFDTQRKKVLQFAELWKEFDITKKSEEDSSSSSSESDVN